MKNVFYDSPSLKNISKLDDRSAYIDDFRKKYKDYDFNQQVDLFRFKDFDISEQLKNLCNDLLH